MHSISFSWNTYGYYNYDEIEKNDMTENLSVKNCKGVKTKLKHRYPSFCSLAIGVPQAPDGNTN